MKPTGCSDGVKEKFQVVLAESVGQDISLSFKQHRNHRHQRVNVYDDACTCNILRVSFSMWQASIITKTLSWVTGCGKWVFKGSQGSAFRSSLSWVHILIFDARPSIVMHTNLI